MAIICDDINQTEQMRFWVSELTRFSPHQVESVLEALKRNRSPQFEQATS